ncbi:MAG: hypothetical protein CMJ27_13535 [Phycisphaerae bacterium]|nr:hypothetical protein [Phycisphaerae bacterium]OUW99907.1 MAG: hypothetical protein CBD91_07800 [Phycisphaeraceae bacterium TMED231]
MIRSSRRRRTLSGLVLASLFSPLGWSSTVHADRLADALGIVPDDAVAWLVIPSLSALNADLGDMLDRANRPELAVAGRPIDVIISQFGIAAGFDERGSLAAWAESGESLAEGDGVIAVPVEDASRFIDANFEPDAAEGASAHRTRDGEVVHLRVAEAHVLISSREDLLTDWKPSQNLADELSKGFGPDASRGMRQADLVMRVDGGTLQSTRDAAIEAAEANAPAAGMAGMADLGMGSMIDRLGSDAAELVIAIDVDALAIGVRSWTRFDADGPMSALASKIEAPVGPASESVLGRLPNQRFYMAMGVDFDGLGGYAGMMRLFSALDVDATMVPGWMSKIGPSMHGMEFAMYPSKLGVAMGGALNDASLILLTDDPDAVRSAMADAVPAMSGVTGALERKTTWEKDVKQRKGGIADEFEMTAAIAKAKQRDDSGTVGEASLQLTVEKMMFGPRGLKGLGRVVGGGYVMTFSRRPDVLARAVEAGVGTPGLDADPTLTSMRSWLPANPDVEMFIDVGQLGRLARQVASLVPGADGMVPELPADMPPIGFGLAFGPVDGEARLEWAMVVPSEVVGLAVGNAISQAMEGVRGEGGE